MTIKRLDINKEFTYRQDTATGHEQVLRDGFPWLSPQGDGLPGAEAWRAVDAEIRALRNRIVELEDQIGNNTAEHITSVVEDFDAIDAGDPEAAHSRADDLLLSSVAPAIKDAHARLIRRARWWGAG